MSDAPEEEWTPRRVFEAMDADGSNSIDRTELGLALTAVMGKTCSDKQIDEIMAKYDEDGDGSLDLMEFNAFVQAMSKKRSKMSLLNFRGAKEKKKVSRSREVVASLEAMEKNGRTLGLHIGTSNSSAGHYDPHIKEVILLKDQDLSFGQVSFPSIVYLAKEGSTAIGEKALARAIHQRSPINCITGIKRMLGEDYDYKNMLKQKKRLQIATEIKRVESDFTTNNETFFTKHLDFASFSIPDFKVTGDEFPPEEIMSLVINNAKRMGDKLEGTNPSNAVLSTPAHWMSYKRKSFLLAAETSGYNASLINNTTASAIAYMSEYCRTKEGCKVVAQAKKAQTPISTAVAYVGGGFFDIATIEILVSPDDHFTYKTTDIEGGDIGGEDLTSRIVEDVCSKLVRDDVDEEARSELTNDPNINAVVDIIADGVSVLGDMIKNAIGQEDGRMTLGEEMVQQRKFEKTMSVSNFQEAMAGAQTDENEDVTNPSGGRVSPIQDDPSAPKPQKESFWRGSRLSDIPNSCGMFVAEAMRVRAAVEEAKKQLSVAMEVDVNIVGFKPIHLTRADIGRIYMDEVAQIQDACASIYDTWSRSQPAAKSKKEQQKKHFDLVIFAGGCTQNPHVGEYCRFGLGDEPPPLNVGISVENLAAIGASIHAAKLNGSLIATEYSNYDIVEILANNIEFTDSWKQDDVTSGKGFWKGSVYRGPKKTLNFYTTDAKQTFLDIYINEDGLPFSTGTIDVLKVPALHEGSDVNVTFSLDENGLIGTDAMFVDLSFSLALKTDVGMMRSFKQTKVIRERVDKQSDLNTLFYERDQKIEELHNYCTRTLEIVNGEKLKGKIRDVDRAKAVGVLENVLKWLDNDGNLGTRKVSLEMKRVEGYKMIYVQKLRETKEIISPILDAIVAIAGKTKIEKGDFCVARVKAEKKPNEFAGYVDPKKKKKDEEVVNSGSDQSHEGMELAMVVDKKRVIFFDDLNDEVKTITAIEHAFPADIEKSRNRYVTAITELNGLRKMPSKEMINLVWTVFGNVLEKSYPDAAYKKKEKEETVVKVEEEQQEEEGGEDKKVESAPVPPPAPTQMATGPRPTELNLLAAIPCLDKEPRLKSWLLNKMTTLCAEADADNSSGIDKKECVKLFNTLINTSLETMHKRLLRVTRPDEPEQGDYVVCEVQSGTRVEASGETLCVLKDSKSVSVFGDASGTPVTPSSPIRRANALDFEKVAEKYDIFSKKLDALKEKRPYEVWRDAFNTVMTETDQLDENGKTDRKTIRYDSKLGGDTDDKTSKEGFLLMSSLMSHFSFFSGESTKLSTLMTQWQLSCKEADVDETGDIDESEGVAIWRGMVENARKANNLQLGKLMEWSRREMDEQDGDVVNKVLKAVKV
ncbi:hypothetical protein TL16_g09486 [Triparma laevis f. inornata]|uniref:EF-hand domain-containing protein n=1 Tax=Triparma laevis f. inornata TaxID=1714386 RepID=A0A9W7B2F0_9STRA|nr:hypothetical protein TL16_g09486 [Triparma laevis f. inornata]